MRLYQVYSPSDGFKYGPVDFGSAFSIAKFLGAELHPRILDAGTDWNALHGSDIRELRCGDWRVKLTRDYSLPGITYLVYSGKRYLGLLIKDADRQWRYKTCHDQKAREMGGFAYSHTAAVAMLNQFPSECLSRWV